jgi:hypothetical protein
MLAGDTIGMKPPDRSASRIVMVNPSVGQRVGVRYAISVQQHPFASGSFNRHDEVDALRDKSAASLRSGFSHRSVKRESEPWKPPCGCGLDCPFLGQLVSLLYCGQSTSSSGKMQLRRNKLPGSITPSPARASNSADFPTALSDIRRVRRQSPALETSSRCMYRHFAVQALHCPKHCRQRYPAW